MTAKRAKLPAEELRLLREVDRTYHAMSDYVFRHYTKRGPASEDQQVQYKALQKEFFTAKDALDAYWSEMHCDGA